MVRTAEIPTRKIENLFITLPDRGGTLFNTRVFIFPLVLPLSDEIPVTSIKFERALHVTHLAISCVVFFVDGIFRHSLRILFHKYASYTGFY